MIAHLQLYIGPWLLDSKDISFPKRKAETFMERVARREARITEECLEMFTQYAKAASVHGSMWIEVTFSSEVSCKQLTAGDYQNDTKII